MLNLLWAHEFTMHHREWRRMNGLIDRIHRNTNIHLGPLCSSSCAAVAADDFPRTFHTDVFRNHGTCSYGTWTNNRPHTYCRRPCFPFLLSALSACEWAMTSKLISIFSVIAQLFFSSLDSMDFKWWKSNSNLISCRRGNSSGCQTLLCFHWVNALAAGST